MKFTLNIKTNRMIVTSIEIHSKPLLPALVILTTIDEKT